MELYSGFFLLNGLLFQECWKGYFSLICCKCKEVVCVMSDLYICGNKRRAKDFVKHF